MGGLPEGKEGFDHGINKKELGQRGGRTSEKSSPTSVEEAEKEQGPGLEGYQL